MSLREDVGHGRGSRGLALQGLGDGGSELLGSVVIQEQRELSGLGGGRLAALNRGLEQHLDLGGDGEQAARRGGSQSLALEGQQGLLVGGVHRNTSPVPVWL